MAQSHFCHHILLAKSASKGEPGFKAGVQPMRHTPHHFKGGAAKSHRKGHGFREAFWDTRTVDLPQGDRQSDPRLDDHVMRTIKAVYIQWQGKQVF